MRFRIVLLGFGVVAQGLANILVTKGEYLRRNFDLDYKIVAVADSIKGSLLNNRGLDLAQMLHIAKEKGSLSNYPGGLSGLSSIETIEKAGKCFGGGNVDETDRW